MKPNLNLATRTYLNRQSLYAIYGLVLAVLVLVLLFNASLYLRSRSEANRLKEHIAEMDLQAAEQGGAVEGFSPQALEALKEEVGFANEILRRESFRWTALLDRLEEVIPKEVLISGIQPDYAEKSLKLVGVARTVADLRHFLDNLIESPHFADVYLLEQNRIAPRSAGRAEGSGIRYSVVLKGAF